MNRTIVITTDDVINFYKDNTVLLYNYCDKIHLYKFKEEFCLGDIKRFIVNNDIELWIIEYCFKSDIFMIYDMPADCFEVAYCVAGEMDHYERSINEEVTFDESKISVFAKSNASGYVKYKKDILYRGVSVISNRNYLTQKLNYYSNDDKYYFNNIPDSLKNKLYMGTSATIKEKKIIDEIINCDMTDANKLMYYEAKANELLILKYNDLLNGIVNNKTIKLSDYDIERIKQAKSILIDNIVDPPSIDILAKQVGLNATKLKKGFKLLYNNTIFGLLRDTRLEYAKCMLFDREYIIAEVANKVGYSNPSKFSRAFKKKYGLNPSCIRNK